MTQFFFDLRSVDTFSQDEEGIVLPDVAAHRMALSALSDAARDAVIEGSHDQLLVVFSSTIFRKQ
jgi:hypothetical protein